MIQIAQTRGTGLYFRSLLEENVLETQQPLVSLLIPICNVEQYLEQCLESACAQTLRDIEIICINDGSTDGSLAIIESFAARDDRIRIIDKPNSGYGDSMNKGIEAARGTYIAILESDDFLDPEALEYMAGRCEAESLDLLKCNFWLYWSNPGTERLHRHNLYFSAVSPEMVLMGVHRAVDVPEIFWAKASIWSVMYRRQFLNDNGIRFLPTPGASFQDTSFSFKAFACAERLAYSSRAFLHYRQDNEKSSVNNPGKVYCVCDEHHEISRFLTEDRPDLKAELDPIRAKMKFYNYHWNLDRLSNELSYEFLDTFSSELREEFEAGTIQCVEGDAARYGFNEGELREAREIAYDSRFFGIRFTCDGTGKLGTLMRYLKAGGPAYVARILADKAR